MAEDQSSTENTNESDSGTIAEPAAGTAPAKKAPAKRAAAKKAPAKKAAAKRAPAKKAAAAPADTPLDLPLEVPVEVPVAAGDDAGTPASAPAKKAAARRAPAKRAAAKKVAAKKAAAAPVETPADAPVETAVAETSPTAVLFQAPEATTAPPARRSTARKRTVTKMPPAAPAADEAQEETDEDAAIDVSADGAVEAPVEPVDDTADDSSDESDDNDEDDEDDDDEGRTGPRRRRRRGGRRRRKPGDGPAGDGEGADCAEDDNQQNGQGKGARQNGGRQNNGGQNNGGQNNGGQNNGGQGNGGQGNRGQGAVSGEASDDSAADDAPGANGEGGDSPSSRRRRRRRRDGEDGGPTDETGASPATTTTRVRRQRSPEDEITAVAGSTRLEAKKQRRREGREAGRRRAPIVSEAEFLARREAVERVMVVRQRDDITQIGVLEDKVLVEHYVARESQTSLIGNVYLGRVQNVLPSMEAAFIDIGKGRNAVLYAGEVNWSALGHKDGQARKIESVLSSGQTILVQVSKDPIGHKGARLTSQISLAGRFLVYVPDGTTSGISRKLPDTERNRLKTLLKEIVPDTAGVIVRTAAEGASEEELTTDVERLKARWDEIEAKTTGRATSPQLLYGEPDLTLKIVRDLFTEDFAKLVIQGDEVWDTVRGYVTDMAPDLEPRLEKYAAGEHNGVDLFAAYRIEEQIAKALDRKVWLPSGGSLVIDRTEAMTVVDVNTGKFTGSGGNLEETVTKNNLEAAEEVVRQLRLRDIGGIIVVDFIDMVLESNRDLVLRRMVECLGRDRTRHQVAEVTSLGLVQMTRKRIGTGLLESFSENCQHCQGRGVVVHDIPVDPNSGGDDDEPRRGSGGGGGGGGGGRRRGGRGRDDDGGQQQAPSAPAASKPSPAEFAAMAKAEVHREEQEAAAEAAAESPSQTPVESPADASSEAPVEPAAPKVVTRSRRGAGRSTPVSTAVAEPTVAAPVATPDEDLAPVVAEAPVEPAAPKVVTRSRRGASRTTPTPTATVDAPVVEAPVIEAPVIEAPVMEAPAADSPAAESSAPQVVTRARRGVSRTVATAAPTRPVEVSAAVVAPAPVAVESAPAPPKVITRTRGGASRGGATSPSADTGTGTDSAKVEPASSEVDQVPVKKSTRTRKR